MNMHSRLGALAHYADNSGHRLATNLAVAMLYPGLAHKYGQAVTYEDKPSAHMKVEYGFDVDPANSIIEKEFGEVNSNGPTCRSLYFCTICCGGSRGATDS
jgi:hypothetical protein